jgi:hypothetical protein
MIKERDIKRRQAQPGETVAAVYDRRGVTGARFSAVIDRRYRRGSKRLMAASAFCVN